MHVLLPRAKVVAKALNLFMFGSFPDRLPGFIILVKITLKMGKASYTIYWYMVGWVLINISTSDLF